MGKRIYITPETSIEEEVLPTLRKLIKDEKLRSKVLDTCHSVRDTLRQSALNTQNFRPFIVRTVNVGSIHLSIHGALKKPSIFKRIFG